jgi:RHS repeat-associated protein
LVVDWQGRKISEMRYAPWGETRWAWELDGEGYSNRLYTSQIAQNRNYVGQLYDYAARFYNLATARLISPDTVPDGHNRYQYVRNNPLKYSDPTGHLPHIVAGVIGGGLLGAGLSIASQYLTTGSVDTSKVIEAVIVGSVAGGVGAATFGIGLAAIGGIGGAGTFGALATTVVGTTFAGSVSGVASGIAGRATENLISLVKGEEASADVFASDAMIRDGFLGGLTAGAGKYLQRAIAGQVMQNLVNNADEALGGNISLVKQNLQPKDFAAARKSDRVAGANYGKAIETEVTRSIKGSRVLSGLFDYLGGPGKPDFVGKSIFGRLNFDVTGPKGVSGKSTRPYFPGLIISTHSGNPHGRFK